jgi:hypothetical protein
LRIIASVKAMKSRTEAGSILRSVAASAVLAAVLCAPAFAQERVAIPDTSVSLTPPPGFSVTRRGLDDGAGSTITISERPPGAHAELIGTFSSAKGLSDAYAEQGVKVRGVRQITTPNGAVPFGVGTQSDKGRELVKYFALLKGDKTVLVVFNIAGRSVTEAAAEALVRSVEIAPAPTLEAQLEGLSFTFAAVEPFEVKRIVDRNTVTLEAAGDRPDRPLVIVIGRGQSRAGMGDEARVAVEILKSTSGFREAVITEEAAAPFAGGAGYVVKAAVETRTVVQYLRIVPGGAYLRFLARGEAGGMEAAAAAIAEIAASVAEN